jgi:prolyl-tRNA synthetase
MRVTRSLLPTLREDPADAEAISHKLMLRAGLVRQLAAGVFVWLPLGQRVLDKVNAIIREEMNAIGGQEITMPVIHPGEIWKQSGRWDGIPEMFKLKDRHGRDMCLGMTHEEVIAWLASREIRSYRDLPQIWYQIQTKERDEARPRSGVLRTREFVMKDSYTLDPDEAALDVSYAAHEGAYRKIFTRSGLDFHVVQSDTGMMGGLGAHEFMAPSAAGEDEVAMCAKCGYAANVELARSVPTAPDFPATAREEVATPNVRTIADVAASLKIDPRTTIKSLLFIAPKAGPVLVLVRGDHTLHERKLTRAVGEECRPAQAEEVRQHLGVPVGSVGPIGVRVPVVADETLKTGTYVVGANREGFHVRGVTAGRDFQCTFADLHTAQPGEACVQCGGPLSVERVIEIGNIFKLGTKYGRPRAAGGDGELWHRAGTHRGNGDRAGPRCRRHHLAVVDRAVPGPRRLRRPRRGIAERGPGDLRRLLEGRSRCAAGRSRRAPRREVQGRGSAGDSRAHHRRQPAREGRAGRAEGAADPRGAQDPARRRRRHCPVAPSDHLNRPSGPSVPCRARNHVLKS